MIQNIKTESHIVLKVSVGIVNYKFGKAIIKNDL